MKKLIPALCMLLVAACLMGTSTYAWFSANKAVSATGMQVKAVSTGGLLIASYKAGGEAPAASDFVTAATLAWSNAERTVTEDGVEKVKYDAALNPTSYTGTSWKKATAAKADVYEATGGYSAVEAGTENQYYLLSKWVVKTLDESGANHDIAITKIELSGSSTAGTVGALLEQSLRIMVVNGSTVTKFAPNYAVGGTYSFKCAPETGTTAAADTVVPCGAGATISQKVGSANNAGDDTFEVYIYFEGEDPNCKTKNAVDLKTITVTLHFTDLTAD